MSVLDWVVTILFYAVIAAVVIAFFWSIVAIAIGVKETVEQIREEHRRNR